MYIGHYGIASLVIYVDIGHNVYVGLLCSAIMYYFGVAGERFEQLMLRFTAHIVRVVCLREAKGEGIHCMHCT